MDIKLKFDFVETARYKMDVSIPEDIVKEYAKVKGYTYEMVIESFDKEPEVLADDFAQYIVLNHENFGDALEYHSGSGMVFNADIDFE